jgi:hypothetical protein
LIVVGQDPSNVKFNTFNIYDLKNKFIAYSETKFQNVTQVVSEWGSIYVVTGDGKVALHAGLRDLCRSINWRKRIPKQNSRLCSRETCMTWQSIWHIAKTMISSPL